jgi:PIN domain nuclease of toxin-antitoxin system
LDTQVFLWIHTDPSRLGRVLRHVEDGHNQLLLSAASSWEIAIKHGAGRLNLPESPARYVAGRIQAIGATALAIEHAHAFAVADLPPIHRDPFDRMLVAQARALGLTLVTADPVFAGYDVDRLTVDAN